MENKIKYAEHNALKWIAEDFNSQVMQASEDGQIVQFKKDYFFSLSDEVKIQIIEDAISNVQSELCELILSAIYDQVMEHAQWSTTKTENNG